ncbi:F-box/WD repeat-containing protein 12 isoform X2 [Boleophthalmus pectinirostris]|uniref:F-box/WD repeat-containing protein 12 isoform X2 n=1 Tax=Boleophthalmus pectinirostris TaxID=150288 RepID=UPI00242B0F33|nr:F-box/WD repeat-containing protein 12 isoform X2 [Boleophthalmus pectinirostris]
MDTYLIKDCLIHIFTFLSEKDLFSASSVCKDWNDAAETPWLWRRMSLQRWVFCNVGLGGDGAQSWKRYFLRRYHLEKKMSEGKTGGYTCKSLRGHTGRVIGVAYLNSSDSSASSDLWSGSATVCSASTDGSVRVWGVQKGELLWSSPASQNPMMDMITDQQHNLVVTADTTGLITTWHGQTGQQMATFATGFSHTKLLQYTIDNNWFLTVGGRLGSVITLAGPDLIKRSTFMVCDSFQVTTLLISPDKKWLTAGTKDNDDLSAKVMYTESLIAESEDDEHLCQSLPVAGCRAAVFIPTQPSRLAVVHTESQRNNILTVFDICLKKSKYKTEIIVNQVRSFSLNQVSSQQFLLKAKDSNCIVLAAGDQLLVYSLTGELLQSFSDHTMPISALWVDSFRAVTASLDLSLRVLTWKNNRDGGQTLEGRYHLLGGSHSMSRNRSTAKA